MNSPSFPSADETLARLRSIQETVRATAKREETLLQGRRLNHSRRQGDAEEAIGESARRLEADLARAEEAGSAARVALAGRRQERRVRIDRAHLVSRRAIDERIRSMEGQGHYDRQKNLLLQERQRDQASANAREFYEEVRTMLGEIQRRQSDVERRARRAVSGFGIYSRGLDRALGLTSDAPGGQDAEALFDTTKRALDQAEEAAAKLERMPVATFFRLFPVSALLILIAGGLVAAHFFLAPGTTSWIFPVGAVALVGAVVLHVVGAARARPMVRTVRVGLTEARAAVTAAAREIEREEEAEFARIEDRFLRDQEEQQARFDDQLLAAEQLKGTGPVAVEEKFRRCLERHERLGTRQAAALERSQVETLARIRTEAAARDAEIVRSRDEILGSLEDRFARDWAALAEQWGSVLGPALDHHRGTSARVAERFPAWSPAAVESWVAPSGGADAVPLGMLRGQVEDLAGALPKSPDFPLPDGSALEVPVLLRIPDQASLVVETGVSGRKTALATLNNAVYRLLGSVPPGRIGFTFLDPVGLGESFSGLMNLADFEESLIGTKIWTQADQIERRLGELNEHMEKVIQMYLRNEYRTISEYNEKAGNIAEKYRFLVVADFPHAFSPTALQRLLSIAASGPRCGVFLILHWDRREPLSHGLKEEDLRHAAVCFSASGEGLVLAGQPEGLTLELEAPPAPDLAATFLQRVGRASIDSTRVEVPFAHIAPPEEQVWSLDAAAELRVPIGRTGATKLQFLSLGKGTRQHVLIAGKTGSGKSTLFHVMVTNLALWADPDQVEFYLIDFKKGVEFKCYANHRLPHAKVVAIESDREFGLSVLQRVDEELRRRGELFRQLGAQDIPGYFKAGGRDAMPRSLLLIDEFQEFFTEDDRIAQNAALLLDRIVRQGRAFGIHVILGSQTLGGAFTLARATFGQMVVRIALQCNEADSYLILDDANPAARLLTRPGEGIYNDNAGAPEGNSPFQVVWLDDDTRESYLIRIRQRADMAGVDRPGPVVFEGNVPADVRGNEALARLRATPKPLPGGAHFFLGAPNSIKGPTEVVFKRESGNHLLIVGQQEETVAALAGIGLVALSAQHPPGGVRFVLLEVSAPGSAERTVLERAAGAVSHETRIIGTAEIDATFADLAAEVRARGEEEAGTGKPSVFVFILGLQRYKKLRHEDDFGFSTGDGATPKPDRDFATVVQEGAAHGIHLVVHCDTFNNISRFLSRKALGEFGMRLLFQMSANDSASLIDSPKASSLGLNRALLHNEQEGTLETFRPYALPDAAWFGEAG